MVLDDEVDVILKDAGKLQQASWSCSVEIKMSIGIRTSETIAILLHELLIPINSLVAAAHIILKDQRSQQITVLVHDMGEIGEKLKRDVEYLYHHIQQELTIASPVIAASQIRQWVLPWKQSEGTLCDIAQQLCGMRASGFKIDDPALDKILDDALPSSFQLLNRQLAYLENIKGEDLIFGDYETLTSVYQQPYQPPLDSEQVRSAASIARSKVYKLIYPLNGLELGYSILKDQVHQPILASICKIGEYSKVFKKEAIDYAEHFAQDTNLSAEAAAHQIRQKATSWKVYMVELTNAIREIRQTLHSGVVVDADSHAVIVGALYNAFDHLERVWVQLETINNIT